MKQIIFTQFHRKIDQCTCKFEYHICIPFQNQSYDNVERECAIIMSLNIMAYTQSLDVHW